MTILFCNAYQMIMNMQFFSRHIFELDFELDDFQRRQMLLTLTEIMCKRNHSHLKF